MTMYAQAVRFRVRPGTVDQALETIRNVMLPAARSRPGFQGAYVCIDRDQRRIMGVSLWETEAHLDEIVASGFFQQQMGHLKSFLSGPPEREVYEVAAHA